MNKSSYYLGEGTLNTALGPEIKKDMTMGDIITHYPSAKRALFQKYHVGGCSSCGYALDETLEEVMINHKRDKEVGNAISFIYESAEIDKQMQLEPTELKQKLENGETVRMVDVREDWEADIVKFPDSELINQNLAYEILNKWDKNTLVVFYCHQGMRSLEAASYFKGHGLPNVKSLSGGIDRYAAEVDTTLARY